MGAKVVRRNEAVLALGMDLILEVTSSLSEKVSYREPWLTVDSLSAFLLSVYPLKFVPAHSHFFCRFRGWEREILLVRNQANTSRRLSPMSVRNEHGSKDEDGEYRKQAVSARK